jgi:hypothetical protein
MRAGKPGLRPNPLETRKNNTPRNPTTTADTLRSAQAGMRCACKRRFLRENEGRRSVTGRRPFRVENGFVYQIRWTPYASRAGSTPMIGRPSERAWAAIKRSNGSRWCIGSFTSSARCTTSMDRMPIRWRSSCSGISSAKGRSSSSFPSPCLMAISHWLAALIRMELSGASISSRARELRRSLPPMNQTKLLYRAGRGCTCTEITCNP